MAAEGRDQSTNIYLSPCRLLPRTWFSRFSERSSDGTSASQISNCPMLTSFLEILVPGECLTCPEGQGAQLHQSGWGVLSSPPPAHSQLHPCTEQGYTPKANLVLVSPGSNQLPESWLCRFQALVRMTQVPDWLCCMPLGKLLLLS